MTRYLEDWELDMLLGGDGTPEMEAALASNAENQARFTRLQNDEKVLFTNLFRTECPSSLELGEWHLKLFDNEAYERIRAHIDLCPHCQEEVDHLVSMLDQPLLRTQPQKTGPAGVIKRIIMKLESIFPPKGSEYTLGNYPGPVATPVLLRGSSWSVCYAGGDYLLSLTRQNMVDGEALIGSVLASSVKGHAFLKQGHNVLYQTALTDTATFTFDSVNPGSYELVIATPQAELIVPQLNIE
jgi:hypothetical protein